MLALAVGTSIVAGCSPATRRGDGPAALSPSLRPEAVVLAMTAVADWQLTRFRENPANAGNVMDRGMWAWSRHPNYFGDALMWWGFFAIGFAATQLWWLMLSPVAMTILLLRISGVALLEETIAERRPAYADYIRRTSAFIPWPPAP